MHANIHCYMRTYRCITLNEHMHALHYTTSSLTLTLYYTNMQTRMHAYRHAYAYVQHRTVLVACRVLLVCSCGVCEAWELFAHIC